MPLTTATQYRYATKAFDPNKKISDDDITQLKQVLRFSPSSINFQPWHFIVATSTEAKEKIAEACQGSQAYNSQKIKDASMVVVLCAKTQATSADVQRVIEQEDADGRYDNETVKKTRFDMVNSYIKQLNQDPIKRQSWLEKQCYIALGNALLAAADMGIDSVAMEGFDAEVVDTNFALADKGLHAVVLAGFGYRSESDFNADLPKSRLPENELFTEC